MAVVLVVEEGQPPDQAADQVGPIRQGAQLALPDHLPERGVVIRQHHALTELVQGKELDRPYQVIYSFCPVVLDLPSLDLLEDLHFVLRGLGRASFMV